jgi:SAM-dependent methyltransferase
MLAGLLALGGILLPPAARAAEEVPYVQTPQPVVDGMLMLGRVSKGDRIIDLGSGDGRIVIGAARRGASGFGVDLDTRLVELATARAREAGVADRVRFLAQDLYKTDLRGASVITMYLLPDVNLELRPRLLAELKPGTRIVSHDFDMGDWRPDEEIVVPAPGKKVGIGQTSRIMLWWIPASIGGRWSGTLGSGATAQPVELDIEQRFQAVRVAARVAGRDVPVERARLLGADLSFGLGGRGVALAADGNRLVGEALAGESRLPITLVRRAP